MKTNRFGIFLLFCLLVVVSPLCADDNNTNGTFSAGISSKKQFEDGFTTDERGKANPVVDVGLNIIHKINNHFDLNGCLITFIDTTDQRYRNYINETDGCVSVTGHYEHGRFNLYIDIGVEVWWNDGWSYDGKAIVTKATPGVKIDFGELAGKHNLDLSAKLQRVETLNHNGGYRAIPKLVYSFTNILDTNFGTLAEGGAFVPISGRPYGREYPNGFVGGGITYSFEDTPVVLEGKFGRVFAYSAGEGEASTFFRFGITLPFSF